MLSRWQCSGKGEAPVFIWGGLRSGIAVALALSLPASKYTSSIPSVSFAVVLFSIIVQDVTVGSLIRKVIRWRNVECLKPSGDSETVFISLPTLWAWSIAGDRQRLCVHGTIERSIYFFESRRWSWVIVLGYVAGIGIHFLVRGLVVANAENFTVRSSRSPTRALLLYIRYRGEQHIYSLYR